MAGIRVYGGSEMNVLLQNGGIPVGNFEDFLSSSSSSHGGFNGSRSMLNFEEACGSTVNHQFYRPGETEESVDEDLDECLQQPEKKRRRLTANQVQFLEKSFEVENKLEPERKIQLAKDLGLQPRQVAIWFQNRRARWKTKQIEKDYDTLKLSYNALKADYESMLKEKEKLKAEVLHLSDELLLSEKHKGVAEALEINTPEHNSAIETKKFESQPVEVRQEDQSSTNSAVSDSESPHCIDGARTDSLNVFEPDQSDTSYVEEDEEAKVCHEFLKLDDHPSSFDFPVAGHPFWVWP